jgi:hypothetical protein
MKCWSIAAQVLRYAAESPPASWDPASDAHASISPACSLTAEAKSAAAGDHWPNSARALPRRSHSSSVLGSAAMSASKWRIAAGQLRVFSARAAALRCREISICGSASASVAARQSRITPSVLAQTSVRPSGVNPMTSASWGSVNIVASCQEARLQNRIV